MKQYRVCWHDAIDHDSNTWFDLGEPGDEYETEKGAQDYIDLLRRKYPEEIFSRYKIQEREVSEWRDV